MGQGNYLKFPPEQWMHRIGDFNLGGLFCQWVVEGGINKGFSLTELTTQHCSKN
jgi:hypothetical protein